jgi:hypothetical protein
MARSCHLATISPLVPQPGREPGGLGLTDPVLHPGVLAVVLAVAQSEAAAELTQGRSAGVDLHHRRGAGVWTRRRPRRQGGGLRRQAASTLHVIQRPFLRAPVELGGALANVVGLYFLGNEPFWLVEAMTAAGLFTQERRDRAQTAVARAFLKVLGDDGSSVELGGVRITPAYLLHL